MCTATASALIETVRKHDDCVVVAIGPLPNLAAAVQRAPEIALRSRLVGMHGSVRRGYMGADEPHPEYNVAAHPKAAAAVFESGWETTITPLDTFGIVSLRGDRFARCRAAVADPLMNVVLQNHDLWCAGTEWVQRLGVESTAESSVLYDTVAVYTAFAEEFLEIETLPIRVDDEGRTIIDEAAGNPLRCATEWRDLDGFLDLLTQRLTTHP